MCTRTHRNLSRKYVRARVEISNSRTQLLSLSPPVGVCVREEKYVRARVEICNSRTQLLSLSPPVRVCV